MKNETIPKYRAKRERGSSDGETLILVMVVITLATIVYLMLGWVKSVKDERIDNDRKSYIEKLNMKSKPSDREDREPSGHQVVY
jgi:hypothetical protein